jgi:hypothetical protein
MRTFAATTLLLALTGASAHAQEMLVQGKVISVVPNTTLVTQRYESGICEPAKPGAEAGLVELLKWDLRTGCRSEYRHREQISGYSVEYRWGDRTYNTVMAERPGDFVPLRVSID